MMLTLEPTPHLDLDHHIYPIHTIQSVLTTLHIRPTEHATNRTLINADIDTLLIIADHLIAQLRHTP